MPGRRNTEIVSMAAAFDSLRSDYNAAKTGRFRRRLTGVASAGSGSDYHYRSEADFLRMMEYSRAFDRNDIVTGQGVSRVVDNVLQDGIRLDPTTGDEALDTALGERWEAWGADPDQCHSARELTFPRMAKLALRATIFDGDCFVLPLDNGRLEPIEAHRCRTPRGTKRNVVHGVLLDEHRERLEYWFTKDDINPLHSVARVSDMRRVPARDGQGQRQVFQIYNPKRFSQTRGVTLLAAVVDAIGMHDDLQFANLVRAQVAACFAIITEVEAEAPTVLRGSAKRGAQTTDTHRDGSTRLLEGVSPGMDVRGNPGEKIKGFAPNVPNPEFFDHAKLLMSFIAVNLGIPVQVLLLDPSQTNFSGWRGAIDQARIGFRSVQEWIRDTLHRPVYLWKVRQWIADDPAIRKMALKGDVDVFGHRWMPSTWQYIEPNKDAQADERIIAARLSSRRRVLGKRGLDIEEVDREIVADNVRLILSAIEQAGEINKAHPDAAIDWRELIGFDPKGRKPQASKGRAIEDIARAVRAGVPIAVAEARAAMGLTPDPPKGAKLRFNDQDLLGYHIETGMVMRSDVRKVLDLEVIPERDDVFMVRQGITEVRPGSASGGAGTGAGEDEDEDEEAEETEDKEDEVAA